MPFYENPQNFLIEPSGDVPVARVLASQSEFLKLLATVDATDRLTLRFASDSDRRRRVGMQCMYKDTERDRLILDARPQMLTNSSLNVLSATWPTRPFSWRSC